MRSATEVEEGASSPAAGASGASSSDLQYPGQPDWDSCVYRGEGNSSLVVALPAERKVIRLRKSPVSSGSAVKNEDKESGYRDADFIRRVISGLLGGYVCTPEILRCEPPEITRLSEKIRPKRPENRRSKDIVAGYACVYPDYTLLPNNLSSLSERPTYCVEIKPKQGFLNETDRSLKKCHFCLMQYYKVRNGHADRRSGYCPLDLYSGDEARMERALESLLRTPQNNLRIFVDGRLAYGDDTSQSSLLGDLLSNWLGSESRFLALVREALTRPLDEPAETLVLRGLRSREISQRSSWPGLDYARLKPELVRRAEELLSSTSEECEPAKDVDGLARGSVLGRILRMQQLHRVGNDVVAWLAARLLPTTPRLDRLIYADLLATAADCEDKQADGKQEESRDRTITDESLERSRNVDSACTEAAGIDSAVESISLDYCVKVIGNYLLHCTARDCSILLAFQKIDGKAIEGVSPEHVIKLNDDQHFLFAARILDVDYKSVACIEKHRKRDNAVLEAVIETLEKSRNTLNN